MIKNNASKMALSCQSHGEYESPEIKTFCLLPEGVFCTSVQGILNEDFGDGGYYEL